MIVAGANLWNDLDPDRPPYWAFPMANAFRALCKEDAVRLRELPVAKFAQYRDKPAAYIKEVLDVNPTSAQERICDLLLTPPYKVIVPSCNNYGKSHLAGSLTNWFYDCFDPSVTITTAESKRSVEDVLWAQIRAQRRTRDDFRGTRATELFDRYDHYAKGYTGNKVEAFHGRHPERMLIIIDEATSVKQFVWTGIKSMFKGGGKHMLLVLLNPTDTTSAAFAEHESGNYHTFRLSALEHPNVIAELKGEPAPIPGAVDCSQLAEWFADPYWFEEIRPDEFETGDVIWPPHWADRYGAVERFGRKCPTGYERVCYRPGPEGQARVLGLWPSATAGAIWSDLAWKCAVREIEGWEPLLVHWKRPPQIGCDVARGTSDKADKVSIWVQIDGVVMEHESAGGWDTTRTFAKLKELAEKWSRIFNFHRDPRDTVFLHPKQIPIKIDDATFGGGLVDFMKADGWAVVPVNASTAARSPHRYPRLRDQLWFEVPLAARRGEIDLSGRHPLSTFSKRSRIELRRQLMGVQWYPTINGKRKVEEKDETKRRLQRSPDDADGFNLSFYNSPTAASGGGTAIFPRHGQVLDQYGNVMTRTN